MSKYVQRGYIFREILSWSWWLMTGVSLWKYLLKHSLIKHTCSIYDKIIIKSLQSTSDIHFYSTAFKLFLVLLPNPLAMSSNVCQSSDNKAFKQPIKFRKLMKKLPVFTSSTSNSKISSLILSNFSPCSILTIFVTGIFFVVFWSAKFVKLLKTINNLIWRAGVIAWENVFIWTIAYWIIDSWKFLVLWQSQHALSSANITLQLASKPSIVFLNIGQFSGVWVVPRCFHRWSELKRSLVLLGKLLMIPDSLNSYGENGKHPL